MTHSHFRLRTIYWILVALILLLCLCRVSIDTHGTLIPDVTVANDYAEYLAFLEEWRVDECFVRYENIQPLGKFRSFISQDGTYGFQTTYNYEYSVTDENTYKLRLTFEHHYDRKLEQRTIFSASQGMRTINTASTVEITRGPLHYIYVSGKLEVIRWSLGDILITLRECRYAHEAPLSDYPMDGERTIMSRLLSRNYFVALAAYYELIWDIPLQPGETWLGRMQYIIWPPVILILLIAACITVIRFIRYTRRKKAAMFPTQWHNRRWDRRKSDAQSLDRQDL